MYFYTGNHYYLGFFQDQNHGSPHLILANNIHTYIKPVHYSIEAPDVRYSKHGIIWTANTITINLPSSLLGTSYRDRNKGIYLYANSSKVTVIGWNRNNSSSDTFLALPTVKRCDIEEYVYYGITVSDGNYGFDNVILIVGTESNTNLQLKVTQNVTLKLKKSVASDKEFNFKIHRLQTIYVKSPDELTGTRIIADKPESVFSGHECGYEPSDYESRMGIVTIL